MKDLIADYLWQEHRSKPFDEHFRDPAENDMTAAEWHANQGRKAAQKWLSPAQKLGGKRDA